MSIATQISRLQTAKADIKTSIQNKGVTVPADAKLDVYDTYVDAIEVGGGNEWTPPSDWIDITSVNNNEINLLVCDLNLAVAFSVAVASSGTYTIDWGDGNIETLRASGTTYQHAYVKGSGQACSLGYTTFKIRIYNATYDITQLLVQKHDLSSGNQIPPILWAVFGTTGLTSLANAFYLDTSCVCKMLQSVSFPASMDSVTNMQSAFAYCYILSKVIFSTNMNNITNMQSTFYHCYNLSKVENIENLGSTTSDVDGSNFAYNTYSLDALTFNAKFTRIMVNVDALSKLSSLRLLNQNSPYSGSSPQINLGRTSLNPTALEQVFTDIPNGLATGKAVSIAGALGTDTLVSKASSTTTAGSTTITQSNTQYLIVGMEVYGTGITDVRAVTFTDAGDLVNLTAHGLSNGMTVSFSSITSTTGIVINTIYYVVNASANSFQVSATSGGSALALTTDGSGNIRVYPKIVTINTNTSIVIDVPCSASGTITMTAGLLHRSIALLKGWTITN